ncbi:phage protein [Streptococcus pneumoniae]|nr:phage protein [Streptococcus pneumoniae]
MNVQRLIEKIKEIPYNEGFLVDTIEINKTWLLRELKQLEPEKVTIPQFVADWIESSKQEKRNLRNALNNGSEKMRLWLLDQENYDLFARAWLDGYTIEEEKKYKITLLNRNDGDLYLVNQNADLANKYGHFSPVVLLFTKCTNFSEKCYELTKKEVVSYDFGWVFDCPGIKIEEVE